MKNFRTLFTSLSLFTLVLISTSLKSQILMTAKGLKQGVFKGNSNERNTLGEIEVNGFANSENISIDNTTGLANGRLQHQLIRVNKGIDGSSPQFYSSLATNETLDILLEFRKTNANGTNFVFQTVHLINARLVSINQSAGNLVPTEQVLPISNRSVQLSETLSFSYQKIEIENKESKTAFSDDWRSNN